MVPWHYGKTLAWDVTVVNTLAPSHLKLTFKTAASAADQAEANKGRKYSGLEDHYFFQAVGFETMGGWGDDASDFIS